MAMTDDPRLEMRKRITARLSDDEWMNKHFGISCHAGDVADAVLELFETVEVEGVSGWAGHGPVPAAISGLTRLVLRTKPEPAFRPAQSAVEPSAQPADPHGHPQPAPTSQEPENA